MFSRWLWQTYDVLTQREACLNIVSCSFHHQDCHGCLHDVDDVDDGVDVDGNGVNSPTFLLHVSEVKNKSGWMALNCTFAIYQTNGTSVVCGLTCDPAASFVTRLVQLRVLHLVLQKYYKSIAKSITKSITRVLQRVLHLVLQEYCKEYCKEYYKGYCTLSCNCTEYYILCSLWLQELNLCSPRLRFL